jgi:hypothetical protein
MEKARFFSVFLLSREIGAPSGNLGWTFAAKMHKPAKIGDSAYLSGPERR